MWDFFNLMMERYTLGAIRDITLTPLAIMWLGQLDMIYTDDPISNK
jgi:hypothetical protein